MAWDLTAYATAAEYRSATKKVSTADDALILTMLTSVSRVVDKRCGVAPGMFRSQTSTTFTFDATGGRRLWLRDSAGLQYLLRTITTDSLKVDTSLTGVYDDYLLDLSDTWVQGRPVNAATLSEPYQSLEIMPWSSATLAVWPVARAAVQITGTWGWSAVPGAIHERVISITRELMDTQETGPTLQIADVDGAIQMNPSTRSMMWMLESEYHYRIPGTVAV